MMTPHSRASSSLVTTRPTSHYGHSTHRNPARLWPITLWRKYRRVMVMAVPVLVTYLLGLLTWASPASATDSDSSATVGMVPDATMHEETEVSEVPSVLQWERDDTPAETIVRVVTASRIARPLEDLPAPVDVVERDELLSFTGDDLVTALKYVAGLHVETLFPTARAPSLFMRGLPNVHTLVLVDGVPIDTAQQTTELTEIPLAAVERVEIARGPASAVWGSRAAGGVINFITFRPENAPRWSIQTSAGPGAGVQVVHSGFVQDQGGFVITGQHLNDPGHRENSQLTTSRFTARFEQPLNTDTSIDVSLSFASSERGSPGPKDSPTPRAHFGDRQFRWSASVVGDDWKWRVHGLHYRQRYTDPDSWWAGPDGEDSIHRNRTLGLEWSRDVAFGRAEAHIGASVVHERTVSTDLGPTRNRWQAGLALETVQPMGERFTLTAGARVEAISSQAVQLAPRVGVVYRRAEGQRYRALVGRSFRAPSFNELYWNPPFPGNPDLRPEHGWSFEVGGDHELSPRVSLSWSAFQRFMTDLIVNDPGPINIGRSKTFGTELTGRFRLSDQWAADVRYTYLDARNSETGEPIRGVPAHELSGWLMWKGKSWDWALGVRHRGDRPSAFGSGTLPPHTIVAGSLRVRLKDHLSLRVEGENLFDTGYEEVAGFPMPGRTVWARLAFEF